MRFDPSLLEYNSSRISDTSALHAVFFQVSDRQLPPVKIFSSNHVTGVGLSHYCPLVGWWDERAGSDLAGVTVTFY